MHLGLDGARGDGDLDGVVERLEELVARGDGLVRRLDARDLLAQVRRELLERVELGGELGEVVVGLGEVALLHGGGGDGDRRLLALVLAAGQRRVERGRLVGRQAGERLVEALEHVARADLVAHAGDGVDLLAVDLGLQVEHDEVALGRGAVDADEGAEALAQRVEALGDVLVRDLGGLDGDRERVERGQRDLGADLDLGGEDQLALTGLRRDLGDLDLGLAEGAQVLLARGLAVEAGERVVDGVLDHGAPADALVDDAGRDLALAEAGDVHLLRDVLVGVVDARLELVVLHLDGQLDLGGVQGLDGALHFDDLQLIGAGRGRPGTAPHAGVRATVPSYASGQARPTRGSVRDPEPILTSIPTPILTSTRAVVPAGARRAAPRARRPRSRRRSASAAPRRRARRAGPP